VTDIFGFVLCSNHKSTKIKSRHLQIKSKSNHMLSNKIFSSQIKSSCVIQSWFKSKSWFDLPTIAEYHVPKDVDARKNCNYSQSM